jgi:hypothetical protein
MKMRLLLVLLMIAVCTTPGVARKWTDSTGAFSVEADLAAATATKVTLLKKDGEAVVVPFDRLSETDKRFVREHLAKSRKKQPSAVEKIEAALVAKSVAEFADTPLADVVEFLKDRHNIPVLLDARALDDVGIGSDTPITIAARDLTLEKLLERMLGALDLTWVVRNEVLMITIPEMCESDYIETCVYNLKKPVDGDMLIEDITTNINPDSWDEVGGPGSVTFAAPSVLVVTQTQQNQRKIKSHYKVLLDPLESDQPRIADVPGIKIPKQKLLEKSRAEFIDTPLQDVAGFLKEMHGMDVRLDKKALVDIGLGSDTPVTITVKGISLASMLTLMLGQIDHNLTWSADESGILITTEEAAETKLHLAGYRAADLVVRGDYDTLIEALTSTVEVDMWDEVGGPATIRAGVRGTLDVRQTFQGHQRVSGLLEDLRAALARMR